jgi:hypothetical protein
MFSRATAEPFLELPMSRVSSLIVIGALCVVGCEGSKEPPKNGSKEPPKNASAAPVKTVSPPAPKSADTPGALLDLAKDSAKDLAKAVGVPTEVEVGCAMCVYKKEGVTSCTPAVKLGDTVLLLSGLKTSGHELCDGAKKAIVEGRVEGNTFLATRVEIAK